MKTLAISNKLDERLAAIALRTRMSKDQCLRRALEEFLIDQEDYADALEVSLRVEKGEEKPIPFSDILKKYGV